MGAPLHPLALLVCIAITIALIRSALLRARRLSKQIAEFKAEVKEREEKGIPFNPYLELAQLYQEEEDKKPKRKRSR